MAKKEIIQKLKKMMPKDGKGDILEVSVESPEHEAMEHAPGGPEEGMEDQELSVELMGKGPEGKYKGKPMNMGEPEEGESPEHEAGESEEYEAGEHEEMGEEGEAEPMDLSSVSDEDLQAELDARKAAKAPMTKSPKGKY